MGFSIPIFLQSWDVLQPLKYNGNCYKVKKNNKIVRNIN